MAMGTPIPGVARRASAIVSGGPGTFGPCLTCGASPYGVGAFAENGSPIAVAFARHPLADAERNCA